MEDSQHKRLFRAFAVPHEERLSKILYSFSPSEKAVLAVLAGILVVSALAILNQVSNMFTVEVPARGGEVTEGIIGSPRFINPLLAFSDADRDLTVLVYSGLLKATPEGELVPDLAERYTISDDGLLYTFTLRDDIIFHDKEPVTADDVLFTIARVQDPALKSSKRANWDSVSVNKISNREVQFALKQPYAPFLENATLGILPKHLWNNVSVEQFPFSELNTRPIGSGPYKISDAEKDKAGFPKSYKFKAFENYALEEPYITHIFVRFYANEEALILGFKRGEVESINSISPTTLLELKEKQVRVEKVPLPRIFAVFFNQNKAPIFAHKEIRLALDRALDKEQVVKTVLGGYGTVIDSPLPPGTLTKESTEQEEESAEDILREAGWSRNEDDGIWEKKNKEGTERLQFSLATSNISELKAAGGVLEAQWREMGFDVRLQIFEPGDLNQSVIRPREYEALLFGEIVGRDLDLFAFWHSSQRNDPGLNIALYANITADKLLESARAETDKKAMLEKLEEFQGEIENDAPAVFIYAPDFIYIVPEKLKGLTLGSVTTPGERFLNVHLWHMETEKVWRIFN